MKQLLQAAAECIDELYARCDSEILMLDVGILVAKLRAAIDAPEQEPVAWINPTGTIAWSQRDMNEFCDDIRVRYSVPLYTKPQPVAELTGKEIEEIYDSLPEYGPDWVTTFARAVLAAQKAKP